MRKILTAAVFVSLSFVGIVSGLPSVGDPTPDVTAFDEAGKTFPLIEKLAGKPAVIVFGCMT